MPTHAWTILEPRTYRPELRTAFSIRVILIMDSDLLENGGTEEVSEPARLPPKPLVSVLMLAFNHSAYLAQAIDGVLDQDVDFPIELVVGEDCSTDLTREIALTYQRNYPEKVRVIYSRSNVGMQRNFKRTIGATRGEFIAMCEGDDYWIAKDKLAKQVELLRANPNIDLSIHSCLQRIGSDPTLPGASCVLSVRNKVISLPTIIRGDGGYVPSASIVIRREAAMRIPDALFSISPVGDFLFQIYGSLKGGAAYINRPMCVYRVNTPESWSNSMVKLDNRLAFERKFYEAVRSIEDDIKGHKSAFNGLVLDHYSGRLYEAERKGIAPLASLATDVLRDRYREFSMIGRITVNLLRYKWGRKVLAECNLLGGVSNRVRQRVMNWLGGLGAPRHGTASFPSQDLKS